MSNTVCPIGNGHLGTIHDRDKRIRFLIVGIDYFTKRVKAKLIVKIKASQFRKFIWQDIMTRSGIPIAIVFFIMASSSTVGQYKLS